MMRSVRIGVGAGYSGDRIDPAVELAEKGDLNYLVFECLAERTIALAQLAKRANPNSGYDPLLLNRMEAVLALSKRRGFKIITNMGAANPRMAAAKTVEVARRIGLAGVRVAAVLGDDILEAVSGRDYAFQESGVAISSLRDRTISANAYLGAAPLIEALAGGADVILTGRTADPALFLAPLVHEFSWQMEDWNKLGQATVVGHLLECAGQISGGYFADPGYKDVPNLAHLGFPLAEVASDGSAVVTKVEGSGGIINPATCTEQLLYEIQDPRAYITPDVVADFSGVKIDEVEKDRVAVSGGKGRPRPDKIKTSVGFLNGYVGEGQISYAGPGALDRARLAEQIVRCRLSKVGLAEVRCDFIGLNSILGSQFAASAQEPAEVRLRVAAHARDLAGATAVAREVEALYTNGPAGGGGVATSIKETVTIESILVPRDMIKTTVEYEVS